MHSHGPNIRRAYKMIKIFPYSAVLALALLVSGCTASSLSEVEQQSLAAAAVAAPKLQPGDKIRVYVFGEDKLSGDYEIDQSGQISLPLAGTIQAVGLTQTELEQALAKKFRSEYLRNPKVTVTIATLRPFYMMGEVTKPGRISLQERAQCAHRNGHCRRARPIEQAAPQFRFSGAARAACATIQYQHRFQSYLAM